MDLPARIADIDALEELMSRPSPELVEALARVARRPDGPRRRRQDGADARAHGQARRRRQRRVIGVARFSEPGLREQLQAQGVECIAADLLSREALARLPDAPNIVFMAGRKFGSTGSEWLPGR